MKKSSKVTIIISAIIFIAIMIVGGILLFNKRDEKANSADAIKFKKEYELLNNTTRESDGQKYNNVSISEDNPMVYITIKEALNILDNDNAIIYIGANWCPWCRNAVPVLIEVAKKNNIEKIYYLNIDEDRDTFEVQNKKVVKTKEGTEDYYKLLEKLDDRLSIYSITDDKGKSYNTKEKRIYMPYVIATKNGKVVDDHTGTVELEENQTKHDKMTNDQYKELYNAYNSMFNKVFKNTGVCTEKNCD